MPSVILEEHQQTTPPVASTHTYQTTSGISASMASSMPFAANGGLIQCLAAAIGSRLRILYGTKIADAVAPVSFTASLTLANTGFPKCVSPAFLGFVPPTTFVPNARQIMHVPISVYFRSAVTVIYSLLSVKSVRAQQCIRCKIAGFKTHVPCFPVKPWYMTFVSLFMRRFSAVAA